MHNLDGPVRVLKRRFGPEGTRHFNGSPVPCEYRVTQYGTFRHILETPISGPKGTTETALIPKGTERSRIRAREYHTNMPSKSQRLIYRKTQAFPKSVRI